MRKTQEEKERDRDRNQEIVGQGLMDDGGVLAAVGEILGLDKKVYCEY